MTPAEILRAAKAKIEKPERWTQGAFARNAAGKPRGEMDKDACQWCSSGAIHSVAPGAFYRLERAADFLDRAARRMGFTEGDHGTPFVMVNDETNHATVMKMFDRAIALAEQEEDNG